MSNVVVGTDQIVDRLRRIVNGGELVQDAGTETVTLLLRLNIVLDELIDLVRKSA
jgi:hypothetical protein